MTATSRSTGREELHIEAIVEGIATLKRDLAVLTDHLKQAGANGAKAPALEAVAELTDQAEAICASLTAHGQRTVKSIGHAIEEQPIAALLIAFGVGLIGGRILSD